MVVQRVQLLRKLNQVQGRLKFRGLIPSSRVVSQTGHLDRVFEIHNDVHAALDAFRAADSSEHEPA
jgi:hypothetical protein